MAFPFSNRTIVKLARAIETAHTHTTMDTLFYECSVEKWADPNASNKLSKALNLLRAMQEDGSAVASRGVLDVMVEVLKLGKPSGWSSSQPGWYTELTGALVADGLEFDENTDALVPVVKGARVLDEVSWLEAELSRRKWSVAAGHYDQALENFGRGNWAAASAQLRSLFEDVIRQAGGTSNKPGSGQVQAAADALARQGGVLMPNEDHFVKALWGVLHKHGSHPGLGDEHLARFRLLTITSYLRLLLTRLP